MNSIFFFYSIFFLLIVQKGGFHSDATKIFLT